MKHIYCIQCGFAIVLGGHLEDQLAQERGFCGAGCEEVHDAILSSEMRGAA